MKPPPFGLDPLGWLERRARPGSLSRMVPLKTEKGEAAAKDIIEAQDTGQGAHVYHSRLLTEPARLAL